MSSSLLSTDGYKFSMAEAGWPLRQESFYYSHRKGGAQVMPVDAGAFVRTLLPEPAEADYGYLAAHEYGMGIGFKAAMNLKSLLEVRAVPRGATFFPREPLMTVSGPSALVSWLEPLLLQLSYRVQVATLALLDPGQLAREVSVVTCAGQRDLVAETLESMGVVAPPMRIDEDGYRARVRERCGELVGIVGEGTRIFEVGLRAASCPQQHRVALEGCREAGVTRTSNVQGARELGLVPVGTMGHEHIQRFGADEAAFRAMRERRPQRSSFLLDTFDTIRSGIPAAYRVICERPQAGDSIRYDSGDKEAQYLFATARAKELGIRPVQILEDSFDAKLTRRFEELRLQVGWKEHEQFYGYGGYLVASTAGTGLTRDKVAAVYKLCQTGHSPTMKFANEAGSGKRSIPGRPVLFRRRTGSGPAGIVGQEGEQPPEGYFLLSGSAPGPVSLIRDANSGDP
ncbi:MAG: nicotinate phosphoribosyltransferase, partial [Myxococcaceae bacterium]